MACQGPLVGDDWGRVREYIGPWLRMTGGCALGGG